jgi:hypothetical protein
MIVKFKNRQVEIDGISGTIDEPMIDNAYFLDGQEENLSEEELDTLQDIYMDELSQQLCEKYADDAYDRMTDR